MPKIAGIIRIRSIAWVAICVLVAASEFFILEVALGADSSPEEFTMALQGLANHPRVLSLSEGSRAAAWQSQSAGSWGDPVLKIAAKNIPIKTLALDDTPMSGIELGLSQNFPLSGHRASKKESLQMSSHAMALESKDQIDQLALQAWQYAIEALAIDRKQKVLFDSLNWIDQKIKLTKTLYAKGKGSQQAVLEIQLRKTQLKSQIENLDFESQKKHRELEYIFGKPIRIDEESLPWQYLEPARWQENTNSQLDVTKANETENNKLKAFKAKASASQLDAQSSAQAVIPDVNIGLGYTFRSDLDGKGNFISMTIGIPLGTSETRKSERAAKQMQALAVSQNLADYAASRERWLENAEIENKRIEREAQLLKSESMPYAKAARDITAKSYGVGNASYEQLLRAELGLQELRIQEISLWEGLQKNRASIQYYRGNSLWQ